MTGTIDSVAYTKWPSKLATILSYFIRVSLTVQLTFYSISFYSAVFIMLNEQQIYLFGQIQTSQTVGQLYSDTSPYKISYYSLILESMS